VRANAILFGTFIAIGFLFLVSVSRLFTRRMTIADVAASILFGAATSNAIPELRNSSILLVICINAAGFYLGVWILRTFGQ
jgi:hypothetical protein